MSGTLTGHVPFMSCLAFMSIHRAAPLLPRGLHCITARIRSCWPRPRPGSRYPNCLSLFYFFFEDVDSVVTAGADSWLQLTIWAFPAMLSAARFASPIPTEIPCSIGQRERSVSQPPLTDDEVSSRWSSPREAAALGDRWRRHGAARCQAAGVAGVPCASKAEVKLADLGGNSAGVSPATTPTRSWSSSGAPSSRTRTRPESTTISPAGQPAPLLADREQRPGLRAALPAHWPGYRALAAGASWWR